MEPIRVMVVEDDADFRYLIQQVLDAQPDLVSAGMFAGGEEACRAAQYLRADVVLMDLNLGQGGLDGVEAAREIRLHTDSKVVILTSFDAPETVIRASTQAFASAYVLKSQFSLLVPTIRETARGLTPQAHLICAALLGKLTAAELAVFQHMMGWQVSLHSSEKTIANQQTGVLRKLGLSNKRELRHIFSAYFPPDTTALSRGF